MFPFQKFTSPLPRSCHRCSPIWAAGVSQAEKANIRRLTAEQFDVMYGVAHELGNILDPRYLGEGMDRVIQLCYPYYIWDW